MRATGTPSANSSPSRYGKNSGTRIHPGIGVGFVGRWLRRPLLAAPGERQHDQQQDQRPGDLTAHSRNLLRAATAAARTNAGAVPPKLVRLATERSTSSAS